MHVAHYKLTHGSYCDVRLDNSIISSVVLLAKNGSLTNFIYKYNGWLQLHCLKINIKSAGLKTYETYDTVNR